MNKLAQLKRLSLPLACRMLFIYLKKALKATINEKDRIYLAYLFSLDRCDLRHLEEEPDCFKVVTRDGVFLYMRKFPSSDAQALRQIWTEKEYEIVSKFIKNNFSDRTLRIIDAGSNVGYASVFLFKNLGSRYDLEFINIEPGAGNIAILEKNFKANRLENYHLEKAGLFNKSCYLRLRTDFRDGKEWSLRVEEAPAATDLRGVEFAGLLEKYNWNHVDFFKIDIEGSKRYLFENDNYADTLLSRSRLISIEIHEEFIKRGRIEEILDRNNFQMFAHGEITVGHNQQLK